MAAAKKCVSRREFLAVVAATAALAGCSAADDTKNDIGVEWDFEQDDSLSLLCMEVSGGAVVAATGDGWASNGNFVQLHLGGGSIPGTQVKSVTSEKDGARLTVVLESAGISTRDLVWTEWRLTPPTGVDAASVTSLFLDYGDGKAVELDQLLVADGEEAPDPNGRPVA